MYIFSEICSLIENVGKVGGRNSDTFFFYLVNMQQKTQFIYNVTWRCLLVTMAAVGRL